MMVELMHPSKSQHDSKILFVCKYNWYQTPTYLCLPLSQNISMILYK